MNVNSFQQDQFLHPNRVIRRWPGDFYSIDEFLPSLDGQQLERAKTTATHVTHPANFSDAQAIIYDQANNRFVVLGKSTAVATDVGSYIINHDDLTKGSLYTFTSTPMNLGAHHKQNALYAYGYLWYIGADGDVYKADDYNSSATSVHDGSTDAAVILVPVLDTLWMIDDTGKIWHWDDDDTAFETFCSHEMELDVRFAVPYRGFVYLFARPEDGSLIVYRINDIGPADLRQVTWFPPATGEYHPSDDTTDQINAFALHDDQVIFSPGAYISPGTDFDQLPVYAFAGSKIELVDIVDVPFTSPIAWGLHSWRGRVLLYFLKSGDQRLYVLVGGKFVQFSDTSYTLPSYADLYCVAGDLLMVATVSASDGVYYLRYPGDAVWTSSWLDMGHPTSKKMLSRIAVVVDGACADFTVKVEYRTQDGTTTGSWTTAASTANSRFVVGTDLNEPFDLLQVRVTFDDDTGTYPDVTLESLGVTYSWGVR